MHTMKNKALTWLAAVLLLVVAWGCAAPTSGTGARAAKARFEYNRIMRELLVRAGDATNAVLRMALLDQAALEFQRFERDFRDEPRWAASALRSLGQIQLDRGQIKLALDCFEQVGQRYPNEHWEVIQAWKESADALWKSEHRGEASVYYQQIVTTYGRPGQPAMFDTLVGIARVRLKECEAP